MERQDNGGEWVDDFRTFSRDNPDRSWIDVLAAYVIYSYDGWV
jgi:hypothetical protein